MLIILTHVEPSEWYSGTTLSGLIIKGSLKIKGCKTCKIDGLMYTCIVMLDLKELQYTRYYWSYDTTQYCCTTHVIIM